MNTYTKKNLRKYVTCSTWIQLGGSFPFHPKNPTFPHKLVQKQTNFWHRSPTVIFFRWHSQRAKTRFITNISTHYKPVGRAKNVLLIRSNPEIHQMNHEERIPRVASRVQQTKGKSAPLLAVLDDGGTCWSCFMTDLTR